MIETDVLILGAGLTGLAAASELGQYALVLEKDYRPGGLVKTECFNGYWFDHVIHILHFTDEVTEARIRKLLGSDLVPCPPEAWVETLAGTVRYPFQMHLSGLDRETICRCLRDLAEVTFDPEDKTPSNFEEMLLQTFGKAMCEVFLFPYNRKVWKRPLNILAPSGFQWNISHPEFEKVVMGALSKDFEYRVYNANGWYPRPQNGAAVRGMEVLSRVLAQRVTDLRLQHTVENIDLETHTVTARCGGQALDFRFRAGCCATLPLPQMVRMCKQAPKDLRQACDTLTRNRVFSVALSIRGPRPTQQGHWRYYSDESLIFTRLVYMHEFDPACAPVNGWGLLVEITEPAENPIKDSQEVLSRVRADIRRVGALPSGCEIIDEHLMIIDPAYVVFTVDNQKIIEQARAFLMAYDITPLGRYGQWEYSSMAMVMRDGFLWGEEMAARLS
jgi:protoporphyrinogen oxidase